MNKRKYQHTEHSKKTPSSMTIEEIVDELNVFGKYTGQRTEEESKRYLALHKEYNTE